MVMNQPPMRPRRRARRARPTRVVNASISRRLLRLPPRTPRSRRLLPLTFTGRTTGRTYHQPVSSAPDGDTLPTPAGGRWKLNPRERQADPRAALGRDVLARPEFIRDADQVERLLRRMTAVNPRVASFIPFVGRGGQIDRGKVQAAVDHGFSIIRWYLDEAPSRGRS
jgi:hypothetical protein